MKSLYRVPLLLLLGVTLQGLPGRAQENTAAKTLANKPDVAAGQAIFEGHCSKCHGLDGGGGRGPNLRRPKLVHAADDQALKSIIENGLQPEMPDSWYLNKQDIVNVAAFVRSLGNVPQEVLPGDPGRGKAVYGRSGCTACHILAGEGTGYGPDLTDIGARRGASRLRETLQNPGKTIPEGFLLVEATDAPGKKIRGIRLNEDTFSIQLKDDNGQFHSFRKSELQQLKKLRGETPMPAYESILSPAELDDLVAFLASQRGKP